LFKKVDNCSLFFDENPNSIEKNRLPLACTMGIFSATREEKTGYGKVTGYKS
jgi:hypothetical protein